VETVVERFWLECWVKSNCYLIIRIYLFLLCGLNDQQSEIRGGSAGAWLRMLLAGNRESLGVDSRSWAPHRGRLCLFLPVFRA
jgi:hypothetical protein